MINIINNFKIHLILKILQKPNKYCKKSTLNMILMFQSKYNAPNLYSQIKIIVNFTKIYMKKNKIIISGNKNKKMIISDKMNRVIKSNFN